MTDGQIPILYQLFATRLMARFNLENQSLSKTLVLDLGCGTGEQIVYMARLGFRMSGCDINKDFVETTLKALQATDATPTEVRLSRVPTELPFEANRFHAVYANGVFEHCAEMPSLIAEISRVLIPKGVFLAAFPLRPVIMGVIALFPKPTLPLAHVECLWPYCQRRKVVVNRTLIGVVWTLEGLLHARHTDCWTLPAFHPRGPLARTSMRSGPQISCGQSAITPARPQEGERDGCPTTIRRGADEAA